MKKSFLSVDFGAFVFGRKVLKSFPKAVLHIEVQTACDKPSEQNFWGIGIEKILNGQTKFGRIACFFDRKNISAQAFCENLDIKKFKYIPKKPHRAEKEARFSYFQTQILHEMANEGMADSVEFRRLARKFIRHAKHANIDTIYWLETIFAEEKTRQILDHLAGSQIKNVFPVDFFDPGKMEESNKRELEIVSGDDVRFSHERAEGVLRSKVGIEDVNA